MKNSVSRYLLIVPFFLFAHQCFAEKGSIKISGQLGKSIQAEQMTLCYWENLVSSYTAAFAGEKIVKARIEKGEFQFEIETEQPFVYLKFGWEYDDYGNLIDEGDYQYFLFIGERGDDVYVKIDSVQGGYNLSFSGAGAPKYSFKNIMAKNYRQLLDEWAKTKGKFYPKDYRSWRIKKGKDLVDFIVKAQLATLTKFKKELSAFAYNVFKTDIISEAYLVPTLVYKNLLEYPPIGEEKGDVLKVIKDSFEEDLSSFQKLMADEPAEYLRASAYYSDCMLTFAKVRSKLNGKRTVDEIKKNPDSEIRDKMFASYCIVSSKSLDKPARDSLFGIVSDEISNPVLLDFVMNYKQRSGTGASVYNFSLPDINGKLVNLSDFKGKVVFVDFWFVGCANCSVYHQNIVKPVKQYYKGKDDVVFVTISVDRDRGKWIEAVKSGQYTTEQAINLQCPDGNKNPVIKQFNIIGFPQPLIIDREGLVFSDSAMELRDSGSEGLIKNIELARKSKTGIAN